ncbi:hypothetical protein HL667_32205 [Bradyrhizobium sp. 83012]|uniref:Bacteriocin n=1 Tax=Bradyrhizobium aeschynomenes TaxID=2734909 RepID=A0ABX2CNI7_9BRAD|nr:hypothetical protein [Bradyrhizobium aeschynomenes]NPU15641.1 hypothetical protein [Bradyrhizobium aeschynomenes]NPU69698.1 hypothetical protein [Bradyrhizobium aeschynomenes]NPV24639.1 hypothetical protein [Bradyrhizobium aeschynomenes]
MKTDVSAYDVTELSFEEASALAGGGATAGLGGGIISAFPPPGGQDKDHPGNGHCGHDGQPGQHP